MSTVLSQIQLQQVPSTPDKTPRPFTEMKTSSLNNDDLELKRQRLTRSSSLERIIKFNSYICSQNYYILPALLTWFKTSQNAVQVTFEKSFYFFRWMVLNSMVYKIVSSNVHALLPLISWAKTVFSFNTIKSLLVATSSAVLELYDSRGDKIDGAVLAFSVYCSLLLIFAQFAVCVFFFSTFMIPAGLAFLFFCLYLISHINYKLIFFYLDTQAKKSENKRNAKRQSRPGKRVVARPLSNKTISRINFFN